MSWEPVLYKNASFDADGCIISWVQKYMELYLSSMEHPDWFKDVLDDLHGNFHVSVGKYFFDEDTIGDDPDRLSYAIKMIDLTAAQMGSITKKEFVASVSDAVKGSWCDMAELTDNETWLNDNDGYRAEYIGLLQQLKEIMQNG